MGGYPWGLGPEAIASIFGAVCGLAAGVVGSIATPWVGWWVEKSRLQYQRRQELIQNAREAAQRSEGRTGLLFASVEYSAVRGYLDAEIRRSIESETIIIVGGHRGSSGNIARFLDALSELEAKWGLVGARLAPKPKVKPKPKTKPRSSATSK